MATINTLPLILLGLCMRSSLVKSTQVCSIDGFGAFCGNKGLQDIPELPMYITYLDLSKNSIPELNKTSLSNLEQLKELIMTKQTSELVIRSNTFIRLFNLASLQLDYNQLSMDTEAFTGLSNLKNLSLVQCSLDNSILSGDLLKPLVSLEMLVLKDNNFQRIQPAAFFANMKRFHTLDLSYNRLKNICEENLHNFQGKHFTLLVLSSTTMQDMREYWFNWERCGNPFKNMSIDTLDISGNSFNIDTAKRFFDAITGVKIQSLIFSESYNIGRSSGNNSRDPDNLMFKGLEASEIKMLDLSNSGIFALTFSVFGYLSDLEHLTLAENQINRIDNDAFWGMTQLLSLNLSLNFLSNIEAKTFQNLEKLQMLDLSYNNIWWFGQQSFSGLTNLLDLNLTGNSISSFYRFATLPKLEKLYLSDNKISTVSDFLYNSKNLKALDISFNKLSSVSVLYEILDNLTQIMEIIFRGNALVYCPYEEHSVVSPNMQILDLGLTGLEVIWTEGRCLNVFDNLNQLKVLYLDTNLLQSLPKDIFKDLTSLEFLDLSFNSLKYLPQGILPKTLQILNLEFNSIYTVDPDLFSSLSILSLKGNQFRCDCNLKDFQTWLNHTNVTLVPSIEEAICAGPEDLYMVPVVRAIIECEEEEDERRIEHLRLVLFISCSALIILFTVGAIIYTHRRGYIFKLYKKLLGEVLDGGQEEPDPDQFQYDVYLCFSSSDIKWVERALLKRLDTQFSDQNPLRCCFEERDFIPGEDHLTNMRSAIQKSRKTLCVVSEHFLQDGWCLESFTLAQCRMLVELKDILLVLVVGNIPYHRLLKYEQLRSYIENRSYLRWPDDSQELEWFYDQLLHKIRKNTKALQINPKGNEKLVENPAEEHIELQLRMEPI